MNVCTKQNKKRLDLDLVSIPRFTLGIIFFGAGINGLAGIVPFSYQGVATEFVNSLVSSGFLDVVKILEIAAALMLLINSYVPLALIILTPIIVNIVLFHLLMSPDWLLVLAVLNVVLLLWLLWAYREAFKGLWTYKVPRSK